MSELIVVGFERTEDADRVLGKLTQLRKEYLVDLEDAVVAIRHADDRVQIKQSIDMVGRGASYGALSGATWGALVGLLFLNPLTGLVLGGALGAGTGALAGTLTDYGIDDGFIRSIGETLSPNTSALFVLVRKAQPEKVLAELQEFSGKVIRSSLPPDQERRLQEALARMQDQDSQAPPVPPSSAA